MTSDHSGRRQITDRLVTIPHDQHHESTSCLLHNASSPTSGPPGYHACSPVKDPEWAIWFKARHQGWNRKPSDFNQADWLAHHTALLNEHRDRWIQSGYEIRVENQNAFQLHGHSAILAGKPDLLVLNKIHILVIDFKTGQELPWHKFQVMTYMYAMPKALPE